MMLVPSLVLPSDIANWNGSGRVNANKGKGLYCEVKNHGFSVLSN